MNGEKFKMNVVKCSQGHFYDAEKFKVCPHCGVEEKEERQVSRTIRTEETVALNETEIRAWETNLDANERSISKSKSIKGGLFSKKKKSVQEDINDFDSAPITIKPSIRITENINEPDKGFSVEPSASIHPVHVTPKVEKKNRGCTVGWVVVLTGDDKGVSYELTNGNNNIGSSDDMDIVIKGDETVASSKHANIVFEPNKKDFFIVPGDSKELVYIGENVVLMPTKLSEFDKILVGNTTLMFVPLCGEKFEW